MIKIKLLNPNAKLPFKAHPEDAGYDLFASEAVFINSGRTEKIPVGIASELPEGFCAIIKDRSSMGAKGLTVFGGVIDQNYRGEWVVCIHNTNKFGYEINEGDKIAQFILVPVFKVHGIKQVEELSSSDRNTSGFGSTGV